MRRTIPMLALLCALTIGFFSPASQPARASAPMNDPSVMVYVSLKGEPAAASPNLKRSSPFTKWKYRFDPSMPSAQTFGQKLSSYQHHEIMLLHNRGISFRVNRQFNVLLNGFSAHMKMSELQKLHGMPNVVFAVVEPHVFPLLDKAINLVHAPDAWSQLGGPAGAGKGMMIADLDTGIDITNPCFSDKGMSPPPLGRHADTPDNLKLTNNKVIVARAFGGDSRQKFSAANSVGHGTFTASIMGCDYNTPTPLGTKISGVAPNAYLMNYNWSPGDGCGVAGSACTEAVEDPVLAALQTALLDGADVVNMSLGSDLGSGDLALDPFAQAVNLAIRAGVPIIVSAGNGGPTLQSVSSPADAPDAIAVGATTNSRAVITSSITVNGPAPVPAQLVGVRANQGTAAWEGPIGPRQMVFVGLGRKPNDDPANATADDLTGKDLKGKIAVIQRGLITFDRKVTNAANAGAVAAIIVDNIGELSLVQPLQNNPLPTAFISKADGAALLSFMQSHPDATVTLNHVTSTYNETPNLIADFSSRGFGPDYSVKPDLVAPGQDIYAAEEATIPSTELYSKTGFGSGDGTSFSAPMVTAAAALVLQKHPKWTPAMVKDVLVQTTDRAIHTDSSLSTEPPVTEQGSGLLDVQNALAANAYVSPSSLTFAQVNTAIHSGVQNATMSLSDVGGGAGTWKITSDALEGGSGATLSFPAAVQLPANGKVNIPVQISLSSNAPAGNFDGFITLTHGGQTLHFSYFMRGVNQPIKAGSVLLVDATQSRYVGQPPVVHKAVDSYFRTALTKIGKTYTYWDESKLGPPSVNDFKAASAAVVFTGANLNGFSAQNGNYEALLGPLGSLDVSAIRQYMDGGGRVFVSGLAVAESDPYWSIYILGAAFRQLSAYDNTSNDRKNLGGLSPPKPSTRLPTLKEGLRNSYIFGNMKAIDFSTSGDGAGDNAGVYSLGVAQAGNFSDGFVGVTGLVSVNGCDSVRCIYGQAALEVPDLGLGGPDVAIVSSDEPSLTHTPKYPGRSVFFSFDFAGINNNTGYATREQVLKRIFDWFQDSPSALVKTPAYAAHKRVTLQASLKTISGVHAVEYQWQVGATTLPATSKPTSYTFPRAGRYKLRVLITDSLGHKTVGAQKTVTVRG